MDLIGRKSIEYGFISFAVVFIRSIVGPLISIFVIIGFIAIILGLNYYDKFIQNYVQNMLVYKDLNEFIPYDTQKKQRFIQEKLQRNQNSIQDIIGKTNKINQSSVDMNSIRNKVKQHDRKLETVSNNIAALCGLIDLIQV